MEHWKDLTFAGNLLAISNYGRIHDKTTGRKRLPRCSGDPYRRFCFAGKNYRIHRLVAQYFLENPQNKKLVKHIDCSKEGKKNNHISNLKWSCTKEIALSKKYVVEEKDQTFIPIVYICKTKLMLRKCKTYQSAIRHLREFKVLFSRE